MLTRMSVRAGSRSLGRGFAPLLAQRKAPVGAGDWLPGLVFGPTGAQRYRVFRPAGVKFGERLPLMVMLHGCGQDAKSFAVSTRMNRVAARERFLVLYPEQDRVANAQGCWNWFDTTSGRAYGEAALIMKAIDQVCLLYAADRDARRGRRTVGRRQHGGAAGHAASRALQGGGDAFGHPAGHGAFHPVGARRDARPPHHQAAAGAPASMAAAWPPLMVIHGDVDAVVVGPQRPCGRAGLGRGGRRARRRETRACSAASATPMTVTDFKRKGQHDRKLVEVGTTGPRLERRAQRSSRSATARARCVAHGVGLRGEAVPATARVAVSAGVMRPFGP